ncbi:MAG: amidohydrolase family protein, partial [Gammaproteobacteria bacterium]|nr:amidohydrolase family protein [Gammaproteobacteria bacterium]
MAYDVLIQNGNVIDGTGAPARKADIAVQGDRISRIAEPGTLEDGAARVIDASGHTVTPGFVDIHTHLDAQIWWDPAATSSCWHGVTSVVMGNCGVTFAPCREEDRDYLARMMESVEDVPAQSIAEGMPWQWETFGEYLSALDSLPKG